MCRPALSLNALSLGAAAAIGGLALAAPATASIVQIDLNLPTPAMSATTNVDLDGDGTDDLALTNLFSFTVDTLGVSISSALDVTGLSGTTMTAGPALAFGDVIDGSQTYTASETLTDTTLSFGPAGTFLTITGAWNQGSADITGYLGLSLALADGIHYGWAEFSLNATGAGELISFAYETDVDTAILAGEGPAVSPVPLPASGLLLLGGIAGMAARRKFKRAA